MIIINICNYVLNNFFLLKFLKIIEMFLNNKIWIEKIKVLI